MSDLRTINFPIGVPYGTTHFELGRTFEYVEPGIWKSIGALEEEEALVAV